MPRLSRVLARVAESELLAGVSDRLRLWSPADVVAAVLAHAPEPPAGAEVLWSAPSNAAVSTSPTFLQLAGSYTQGVTSRGSHLRLVAWGTLEIASGSGEALVSVRMGDQYLQSSLGEHNSEGVWGLELDATRSTSQANNELRCRLSAWASSTGVDQRGNVLATDDWVDANLNFFNVSAKWAVPSASTVLRLRQATLLHLPS